MQRLAILAAIASLTAPIMANAVTLLDTLQLFSVILNASVGLMITLGILAFFWSLIQYLASSSSEQKGKMVRQMLTGVLALFVMVSIWGLVRLLQNTFKVTSTEPVVPEAIEVNTNYYKTY